MLSPPSAKATGFGTASFKILTSSAILVLVLSLLYPVWSCINLLNDPNYVFWAGKTTCNNAIITLCSLGVVCWLSCHAFHKMVGDKSSVDTWILLLNTYMIVFGLTYLFFSVPFSTTASQTVQDLSLRCAYSEVSQPLYRTWVVYNNLRLDESCAVKSSIEDCDGYEKNLKHTPFLQYMESKYSCAGFCLKGSAPVYEPEPVEVTENPAETAASAEETPALAADAAATPASLLSKGSSRRAQQTLAVDAAAKVSNSTNGMVLSAEQETLPLFSLLKSGLPCDVASSMHLKVATTNTANLFYLQGVSMLSVAVLLAVLKLGTAVKSSEPAMLPRNRSPLL